MQIIKQFKDRDNQIIASIFCEEETGIMIDIWSINPNQSSYFKMVMEYCLDSITQHNISLWLCNAAKLEDYLTSEGKQGLDKIQYALTHSQLKKISMVCRRTDARHHSRDCIADCGIDVDVFNNNVLAMRWLTDKTQPNLLHAL